MTNGTSTTDDEHWAPPRLVIDEVDLDHGGRLFVVHDRRGRVYRHEPLAGMAAVEHRYPEWARGPFGLVEPERELPSEPGLYALVEQGVVRFVGAAVDLRRAFGPRGIGEVRRRDCDDARREDALRVNAGVVAAAMAGRTVDLYLTVTGRTTRMDRFLARDTAPRELAARLRAQVITSW